MTFKVTAEDGDRRGSSDMQFFFETQNSLFVTVVKELLTLTLNVQMEREYVHGTLAPFGVCNLSYETMLFIFAGSYNFLTGFALHMKYIGLPNPTYVRLFNVSLSHTPDLSQVTDLTGISHNDPYYLIYYWS